MALALNNLRRLICHKTKKPNQTSFYLYIKYMYNLCPHFVDNILNEPDLIFAHTQMVSGISMYH